MQKFILKLSAGVVMSCLSASVALAAQYHTLKVTVDCPDIAVKGTEIVKNYGTYLAGPGIIRVNSDAPTTPLFQGPIVPGSNIPVDLKGSGYKNCGVTYNPSNGAVLCKYHSTQGYTPFSVSYIMVNAMNGTVAGSGNEEIHIKLPVGLK